MGLYFRKSINLGGGVRLNLSKRGVGLSAGVKGARISTGPSGTFLNLSIPGTGLYYRKKLSGSNSSYRASSSSSRYPYQRTIVNEYTGETRTVRASTQWELDEQVRNTELRMHNNELRARRNEEISNQRERANEMTQQAQALLKSLNSIISDTIRINDRVDWTTHYKNEVYPEFIFEEAYPQKIKSGFLNKLFKKQDDTFESKLRDYEERKKKALDEYFVAKEEFESEQREHNADVDFLKENFEFGEESAIEKYASIVLANSKYPDELDMDYDVDYIGYTGTLNISFLYPNYNDFPLVERYTYNQSTDEICEHYLSRDAAKKQYEKTIFSVAIRTIHELYEAVYNGAVRNIVFSGYILNGETGDDISDYSEQVTKLFEVQAKKEIFESLSITDNNVNETLQALDFSRCEGLINMSSM